MDRGFVESVLGWAWEQDDLRAVVREAYRLGDDADVETVRPGFMSHVWAWLEGERFEAIASRSGRGIDDVVRIHAQAVSYSLQTLAEQGLSLLAMALDSTDRTMSPAVRLLAEHLRYGVPTAHARTLSTEGLRHRSAAVQLGAALAREGVPAEDPGTALVAALAELDGDPEGWTTRLGRLVIDNSRLDLTAALGRFAERT
jgi:hypothetical protein